MRKGLLLLLITILTCGMAFANAPAKSISYKDRAITVEKLIGPDSELPAPDGLGPTTKTPLNTDDPIGDVFQFGTTWYDIQHNGTCGRQLQIDSESYVHLVWMNGLNNGASQRNIFYQVMDPTDQLLFTQGGLGIQVDQSPRAGYTVMELHSDDRAMPSFHQLTTTNVNFHSTIAYDYFPRIGAFQSHELPWIYEGGIDLEVIWPRMDKDISDKYHIISTENPASGVAGDPQRIYYCRVHFDPLSYQMTFETPEQEEIQWVMVIASDIAASPVSDKVVAGWMQMNATEPDTNQYDNDVILCYSEDGVTWDWTDTLNVTQWIPPDLGLLPDTLSADKDTLRAYTDMAVFIDYNDVTHVFFSTRGYYAIEGTLTWGNGFIFHWDDYYQVFSMVANGWFSNGFYDPGAWNIYAQRPSPAVDPETGDLYCMYQRYMQPTGVTGGQYPWYYLDGDTTDFSAAGFPNGEIWLTKSTDGGYSWSEGINVTNTHSPNANAGDCESELTPSMAPEIVNGYAHIFYILDKDAGAVVQSEGTWTLNDAVYHRVPISEVPESPRLLPFPMHCDSTGMPEDTVVAVEEWERGLTPIDFALEQNYPNPFNPQTTIAYTLNSSGYASLKVYNINGEEVAKIFEGHRNSGHYTAVFDGSELSSGVYFYTLKLNGFSQTRKMVLMK